MFRDFLFFRMSSYKLVIVKKGPPKEKDKSFSFQTGTYLDGEDLRADLEFQFNSDNLAKDHAEFPLIVQINLESAD
jgi:hypothetical protein